MKTAGIEKLKKELENVKEYFIELYKEHEDLAKESRHNYHKYCLLFGAAHYERYRSYLNCERLKRKLELCKSYVNRHAQIDHLEVEKAVNEELMDRFWELRDILADYVEAVVYFRVPRPTLEEEDAMSRIYYRIARLYRLEPDEAFSELWEKTISAYRRDDLEELRACLAWADGFFTEPEIPEDAAALKTQIASYRNKIREYKTKNREIVTSFPYNIGELLADEDYIAEELTKLANENRSYREKAEKYHKALENILPALEKENIGHNNET